MANEEALQHTASLLLLSLSRVVASEGRHAGRTLDRGTVLVTWTPREMEMCQQLPYKHCCVLDTEHRTSGSMGFHGQGFNALGFAKVKYILNALALGHDVLFLDADTLVLQDPLPYLLGRGADMSTSLDRCVVFNDTLAYRRHRPTSKSSSSRRRLSSSSSGRSVRSSGSHHSARASSHHHHHGSSATSDKSQSAGHPDASASTTASDAALDASTSTIGTPSTGATSATATDPDYLSWRWPLPPSNIGMLYFKATAGVTRCVYSWMSDMRFEVDLNPKMWDQDMYGRVLSKCATLLGLRWQAMDPRLFQSACFKECGCAYEDADIGQPDRVGRDGGHFPYMARAEAMAAVQAASGADTAVPGEDSGVGDGDGGGRGAAGEFDGITVDGDDGRRLRTRAPAAGEVGEEGEREQAPQQEQRRQEQQDPESWEFEYMCDPAAFQGWVARHFPCSGLAPIKAQLMTNLLRGLQEHMPVRIRYRP
ncbi:hypothetical protein HYH02_004715 [Chlamydomonas schloesseri]|uniref:Nucleotide-diphospho-sugar transferase domain-containing protein n=1 Tax=Chlamydomonas schloesseri TaxID=2026947 RepID=A0A835WN61_9CHLO|nr:hypothetical protein HYH02_004715 [Chlamydomonas schloesseri]|eukprot:KAG2450883.1 hypothetical protein HYH02_004715 [Chlamydomonas schloesseri]